MINLGITSSFAKVIIDFLNERLMEVKLNNHTSTHIDMVGGGMFLQTWPLAKRFKHTAHLKHWNTII